MNWIVRLWRAMTFARRALVSHWRDPGTSLVPAPDAPPTIAEYVEAMETTIESILERERILGVPPAVDPPAISPGGAPPPPTGYVVPETDTASGATSKFKIWTTGDDVVRYEGDDGVTARRWVEALRVTGVEWASERDGKRWDWGPR